MLNTIQSIPGRRDGFCDLALAVIVQAARDLRHPNTCVGALNWLLSDDYRFYAETLGVNADLLIRRVFQLQITGWKKWKRMTRTFKLVRHRDVSGVSGTGIVAEGVTFDSGQTVVCWTRPPHTLSVYPSPQAVLDVHGHDGCTKIEWDDKA
jgi:hypothetical protein